LKESGFAPSALSTLLLSLMRSGELRFEAGGINQIAHAQADAGDLVAVGRADAALGGADLVLALEHFALGVEFAVVGEHDVRGFADDEVLADLDADLVQAGDFVDEADGVNHHAVADDAEFVFAQDAGRDEVQDVFLVCGPTQTVCPALLPPA
jgi:hypothetical protein